MWENTTTRDDISDELLQHEAEGDLASGSHSADDRAYLLLLYREHAAQARQQETLRSMWSAVMTVLIVGLLAFGAAEAGQGRQTWLSGLLVCIAALLGAAMNQKHFERYELHLAIMRSFRNMLAHRVRHDIPKITMTATLQHSRKFRHSKRIMGMQGLWRLVYFGAFAAGIAVMLSGSDLGSFGAASPVAFLGHGVGLSIPDHLPPIGGDPK